MDLYMYMKANKVSVNIRKTNYIVLKSRQKAINSPNVILLIGIPIKLLKAVKFLGAYLDENLAWKHINYIMYEGSKICWHPV